MKMYHQNLQRQHGQWTFRVAFRVGIFTAKSAATTVSEMQTLCSAAALYKIEKVCCMQQRYRKHFSAAEDSADQSLHSTIMFFCNG